MVPRNVTIINGKNLSIRVAIVMIENGLSLKLIDLPKNSPTRIGVIIPPEKP
jgi:hypothetical protein